MKAASYDSPTNTIQRDPHAKSVLYNRILTFLGFAGLFIAGVLSWAHFWHVIPPCGASSDCDKVTSDSSSMWGGIYVGYIGLAGYVVLTALALARTFGSPKLFRPLTAVGYLMAVGGTLISIGLQFYSYFHIGAMCKWCLSSAITMTITLVVYALLFQELSELPAKEAVPATPEDGAEANPVPTKATGSMDFMFTTALVVLLLLSLGGMDYVLKNADRVTGVKLDNLPANYSLVPTDHPNFFGELNAPVTIVEFADLNCPSCKANSPIVKQFVVDHPGKVRLVYRHLPLPMHKTSAVAAFIDDYAAEKGKFWEYTGAMMEQKEEVNDADDLFKIAANINLDPKDIKRRMNDDHDPIFKRLADDENAANLIGIASTPTFVVLAPGVKPKAFGPSELREALVEPPYSNIINGT